MLALLTDLGWKSALIAGVALLAGRALHRWPAAERVLLLRVALAALLLLPVFALVLPALEIAVLPAPDAAPQAELAVGGAGPVSAASDSAQIDLLVLLYCAGGALLLLRLAAGLVTLRQWTRAAQPVSEPRWTQAVARASAGLRRPVRLRVSPRVATPMSWGVAPAWVLIDPALERRGEQADAVIAHEMAHVRRLDWPMLIASKLATALFWFNPLVWIVDRELARHGELAADDEAITHVARADYAQALLAVAGPGAAHGACGMAITNGALARRIRRVLESRTQRPASRLLCAALLVCAPAAAAPLAAMKMVAAPAAEAPPAPRPQDRPPAVPAAPTRVQITPAAPVAAPAPVRRRAPAIPAVRRPSRAPLAAVERPRSAAPVRTLPGPVPEPPIARIEQPPRPPKVQVRTPRPGPPPGWKTPDTWKLRQVHAQAGPPKQKPSMEQREEAAESVAVAEGLRNAARDLEKRSGDTSLSAEVRTAHGKAARTLRRDADRLERRAQRQLFGR